MWWITKIENLELRYIIPPMAWGESLKVDAVMEPNAVMEPTAVVSNTPLADVKTIPNMYFIYRI
jgi:hypothetical protein